jgi:hypothetical protein
MYATGAASDQAARLAEVHKRLRLWRQDSYLAGIREAAALDRLPVPERQAFLKLWAEVDELLRKTAKAGRD